MGVEEFALMLQRTQQSIPGSVSACLYPNRFYSVAYDYEQPTSKIGVVNQLLLQFYGPWLLGKLAKKNKGFIYQGNKGFVFDPVSEREREFAFLKSKGKKIVCYFVGSDIRSMDLTRKRIGKWGFPNIATAVAGHNTGLDTEEAENRRRRIAQVADKYADAILSWPEEHASYLTQPQYPFHHAYPDELFRPNYDKFKNLNPLVIVHAPSNPLIKGTSYVRQAIEKLQREGYAFEYIELIGVTNDRVMDVLSTAHIVLNQFHQFVPTVFGVEAMANSCVMLCSGDEKVETLLPPGANKAWVVTHPDEIYGNLKKLLDSPSRLEDQARRGFEWARKFESQSSATRYFAELLGKL